MFISLLLQQAQLLGSSYCLVLGANSKLSVEMCLVWDLTVSRDTNSLFAISRLESSESSSLNTSSSRSVMASKNNPAVPRLLARVGPVTPAPDASSTLPMYSGETLLSAPGGSLLCT